MLVEHVPMTILWNRSSGLPRALADRDLDRVGMADGDDDLARMAGDQALDGLEHTRLQLEEGLAAGEPEAGRVVEHGLPFPLRAMARSVVPVQAPKSHSINPASTPTGSPTKAAISSAVSIVRSIGDEYSAPTEPRSPSRRPTSAASARPCAARCRPGSLPGSTLPVVGVVPCRTSSRYVSRGAPALGATLAKLAPGRRSTGRLPL